ncbi:cytochrome c [Methylobacterium sp. C25]|uniref:c-type cytochrome n=1 Tax=Methylobacterium sp. C25 TaxID=2721622 RepID=UPI001F2FCE1C|nr:cytochrome c [Methylobacterium sp. C25]MCE4226486.1 cytochrome c [Methylobacterium sp. C25]
MSRLLKPFLSFAVFVSLAGPAAAGEAPLYGYGTRPTQAQIDAWNIDVRGHDGVGLPAGSGSVDQGSEVFAEKCAACHGTFGEGVDRWPKLAGGEGTLRADRPEPTVGSYWPFASTLYDYIDRAMPFPNPRTLSPDEVYALTAYILNLNNLVPGDFVADKDSLPKVKMPNHDSFTWEDPRPDTRAEPCMTNCRDPKEIAITSTAEGKTLTPRTTGPLDDMQPK